MSTNPPDDDKLVVLDASKYDLVSVTHTDGKLIARCNTEGVWYILVGDQEVNLWEFIQAQHKLLAQLDKLKEQNG